MPCLRLYLNNQYPTEVKQLLTQQLSDIYSRVMHSDPKRMTVIFCELGTGNVWRAGTTPPHPGALMMCDIRRGRNAATRELLSKELIAACNKYLQLAVNELNIEYTQHTGDEMYHQWMEGFSQDWQDDEDVTPV